MEITPARKISGTIEGLYQAAGDDFTSCAVDALTLTFDGISGDFHAGPTRLSGGREPWYPRGTEMRNERQLSILSKAELAIVAGRLDIAEIKPEWIGCNMVLSGIENLTRLPPRTLVFFAGGVTLKIDGDNGPCKLSGQAIADQYPGRDDIVFGFSKEAKGLRGLVAWVEKPGIIKAGEAFEARIPPQWIY
jgi:hypothetical protein